MIGSVAVFLVGGGFGPQGSGSVRRHGLLTGSTCARVANAALHETHGGRVVATEVGDDGYYSVEVVLADGRQVEVDLDQHFEVPRRRSGG